MGVKDRADTEVDAKGRAAITAAPTMMHVIKNASNGFFSFIIAIPLEFCRSITGTFLWCSR
jgi:hypothetical protein